ncbi:MAG: tRNA (adenosine(37)-N6)-threonylcarbamoyltransferase complex dimerization subunit type 1 TsaB [Dehalococcoidia bacterium]|nr:tRNA (adenosine(37)-N6)-threonylcarbamoyltransferase complex dimerization subunit type 1 TsaB [Dehalococcoidia bacterium]
MYLAIDTSSETAGLALFHNQKVIAENSWRCNRNHSVELLPHIDALLKQTLITINDIEGIIVARGPGSFNGIRVGIGSAKGLSFSLNVPIVGISTLEAAAYQHSDSTLPICVIMPAGHQEIASAIYQKQNEWTCLEKECITTLDTLFSRITQPTIFGGEINSEMVSAIQQKLLPFAQFDNTSCSRITALVNLGEQRILNSMIDDVSLIQPLYLRKPRISQPKSRTVLFSNEPDGTTCS